MNTPRLSALALVAALGLAAAAQAQAPPPPPGGMADHGMRSGGMMEHKEMREAARLKAFHDALNIRPDQEGAFSAVAESMKPGGRDAGAGPEDMMRDHQAMARMTTPERLEMMARRMDEHLGRMREHFQHHAAAVRALYAMLTPDQRRTFDALPGLMGHHGMDMGSHGEMGSEGGEE